MSITILLIPLALLMGSLFVVTFIWAVNTGQYDDLTTPPQKIIIEDEATYYHSKEKL